MFNTMTIVKTAGALIGSLLVLLLLNWGAAEFYRVGLTDLEVAENVQPEDEVPAGDTGAGDSADAGAADAGGEDAAADVDVATLMESADAAAGAKVFGKCKACHKLDGKNGVGPHLDGVVGRPIASVEGFAYSDAMKNHATEVPDWTPEAIFDFVHDPKKVVPGTKMTFAGLPSAQDRANLIAYLEEQK